MYILQGRNAEAIDELKQAIALGSTNKQTYNNLGLAYMLSGQPDLAMKEFEATGNQALAHSLAAKLYYRKGEFEKAIEHFKIVTQLAPEEFVAHYRMALIYKQLGKKEEEKNEMALFQKLKAASDERDKNARRVERGDMQEEAERSKKDVDIEPETK